MKFGIGFELTDEVKQVINKTFYAVEANSFESLMLWAEFSPDSPEYKRNMVKSWKQQHGFMITVGWIGDRPINISAFWNEINGKSIMFWEGCSELVDYKMIDEWFDKYFNKKNDGCYARCNAMNFGNCIQAIYRSQD